MNPKKDDAKSQTAIKFETAYKAMVLTVKAETSIQTGHKSNCQAKSTDIKITQTDAALAHPQLKQYKQVSDKA